jgi:hypothetical protein
VSDAERTRVAAALEEARLLEAEPAGVA